VVSFTPRPFYYGGKRSQYPLDRWVSGPHSRSGSGGEKKKKLALNQESILGRSSRSLVTILTELCDSTKCTYQRNGFHGQKKITRNQHKGRGHNCDCQEHEGTKDKVLHGKGKGKIVPVHSKHHAMTTYWGSGSIAPRILGPRH
jgi:hypothetical protein